MKLEVNKWKNIEKKQKEINFKATGFHETNRERKEREEKSRKKLILKPQVFTKPISRDNKEKLLVEKIN